MGECSITTTVAERVPVAISLDARREVGLALAERRGISCAVASRQAVSVSLAAREPFAVELVGRTELALVLAERVVVLTEVTMGSGLSALDRAKLDSIDWGATNRSPDVVKLAYATEKSLTSNDSVDWVGTNTFQEVIQFLVPAPSWRGQAYIEFDIVGSFVNSSGAGTERVTVEVERANAWPTDVGTDPLVFGLPQSWSSVATFQSNPIPAGGGIGVFAFTFRARANGHVGAVFRQTWSGRMTWDDLTPGDPLGRDFLRRTAVDTSIDQLLRVRFRLDYTPISGQQFNVRSASALLVCPRDGSDL